jgi:hypothetical protein
VKYLSLTHFRHTLTESLRDVEEMRTELILTRASGDPLVVLRLDDYLALKDIAALLSSPLGRARMEDATVRRPQVKAPVVAQRATPVVALHAKGGRRDSDASQIL